MEAKTAITKKITIYRGDEYRAKIEREFQTDDIFANVYVQAYKIVNEITHEMQRYKGENKKYATRFTGLGNNIVIFCGARGQGKTSAMQSFSRCLKGGYKKEKKEWSETPDFVEKIEDGMYEVLDSIDPSAMENDESILRVLISRLFYKFEEYIKDKSSESINSEKLQPIRRRALELFQKCYENIDYIKSNRSKAFAQDDLETLSRLGSSAKLKENLYDLVEQYLRLWELDDDENRKRKKYLVIPVDDADLATKKVFQLCEDIRNYLSIPNVIILLAADYDQLVHATYQRYLKQYKVMWKTLSMKNQNLWMAGDYYEADGSNAAMVDECYRMAAKYLEKIFPSGHRVNLPQIDYLLAESYENIKLDYKILAENENDFCSAFPELNDCEDIQEQLIRLLYTRTGILLVSQDEAMHVFLPHTFREITHFVKFLYDMHDIDCDEVYRAYERTKGTSEELHRNIYQLKENIEMVKQHFLYSWCISNLNESERRKIQELDDANKSNQMRKVKKMIREVSETQTEEQTLFHKAVFLYETILLNEWFAAALEQEKQFDRIVQFVETPLDCTTNFKDKLYKKQYRVNQFSVSVGNLALVLEGDIGIEDITCLKNFCVVVQDGKADCSVQFLESIDEKAQLSDDIDELEFNILQPILGSLINREVGKGSDEEKTKEDTSTADMDPKIGEIDNLESTDSVEGALGRMPHLITVRNIIANADMQIYLRNQLDLWYRNLNRRKAMGAQWIRIGQELYDKIGEQMTYKTYNTTKNEISRLYREAYGRNSKFMSLLFLCNEENQNCYYEDRKVTLTKCIQQITKQLGSLTAKQKSGNKDDISDKEVKIAGDLLTEVDETLNSNLIKWEDLEERGALLLGKSTPSKWKALKDLQGKLDKDKKKLTDLVSSLMTEKANDKKEK